MLKFRLSPPLAALAAVIAGAVAALGFEPVNWWPLTIISVAVLIALIDGAASRRRAALLGWLFGTGHFVAGLGWIATAFTFQSKMPPMLGWVTVVLLSMFLAIYAGLAAGTTRAIARTPLGRVLVFAALWMLGEWLRGWVLSGFAWNPLGAAWLAAPGVAQLAAIGGALTLSGLMVLAGGGVWLLIRAASAPLERLAGGGFALLVVIAGLLGSSIADTYYLPGSPQVFLVQPNIGQEEKYSEGAEDAHLQTYLDLTASALAGAVATPEDVVGRPPEIEPVAVADFSEPTAVAASPSTPAAPAQVEPAVAAAAPGSTNAAVAATRPGALVIWSESAVPYAVEEDPQVRARLAAVLGPDDLLLFGGVAVNRDARGTVTSLTNSLFVLDAKGNLRGRYDKAHLVPLGEYVPARSLMTALGVARLAPGDLDFQPGRGPQTLALAGFAAVGVQICYEIIFPGAVVDEAHRPAWIVNISNDAWFGASGPPQHLAQARLRAIEEGLPIARATPTGISALVDANGRIVDSAAQGVQGVVSVRLPTPLPVTFFARHGHVVPGVIGLLLLAAALWLERRRRRPSGAAPQAAPVYKVVDLSPPEPWRPNQPPRAPRIAQRLTPQRHLPPSLRRQPPAR